MSHSHKTPPHYIGSIDKTVVLESHIHGWGLFATDDIAKGECVGVLTGQFVSRREFEEMMQKSNLPKACFIEKVMIGEDALIAIPFRTSYSFINHGEDMLEEVITSIGTVELIALRHIKQGEEITMQYDLETHIDVLGGFNKIKG